MTPASHSKSPLRGLFCIEPEVPGAVAELRRDQPVPGRSPWRSSSANRRQAAQGCQARAALQAATAPQRGRVGLQRPCGVLAVAWGRSPAPGPGAGARQKESPDHSVQLCVAGGGMCRHRKRLSALPRRRRCQGGRGIEPWCAPRHTATGDSSRGGKGAIGGLQHDPHRKVHLHARVARTA